MGRAPCCSKVGLHKGLWSSKEDALLTNYIQTHGEGQWRSLPQKAGLLRCGKSCRLRWMNYLRPGVKRGNITAEEEDLIIRLQAILGNRWSLISGRFPGRTDNEIKNHWNTHILKRLKKEGIEPNTNAPKYEFKRSRKQQPRKKNPTTENPAAIATTGNANNLPSGNPREDDEGNSKNKVITMTKVYAPKPIKPCFTGFTARNNPFERGAISGCSTSSNQEEAAGEVSDISWSSFDQLDEQSYGGIDQYNTCNKDQILLDDYELPIQEEEVGVDQNLLEQVYNEYLRLLNSDGSHAQLHI